MDEVDVYDENENEMDELEQLKEQESLLKRVHGGQDWGRPEWVNKLVEKMLNYTSDFVINATPEEESETWIRGPKAYWMAYQLNKLIAENENESRQMLITFVRQKMYRPFIQLFRSCAQMDDDVLCRSCLSCAILFTKPLSSDAFKLIMAPLTKKLKAKDGESMRFESKQDEDMFLRSIIAKEKQNKVNIQEQITSLLVLKESLIDPEVFSVVIYLTTSSIKSSSFGRKWTQGEVTAMDRFFQFIHHMLIIHHGPASSSEEMFYSKSLHNRLIVLMNEGIINILASVAASLRNERWAEWIRLFLHIIHQLLKGLSAKDLMNITKNSNLLKIQDAMDVIDGSPKKNKDTEVNQQQPSVVTAPAPTTVGIDASSSSSSSSANIISSKPPIHSNSKSGSTGLLATLRKEKTQRKALSSSYNRYAGVYKVQSSFKSHAPSLDGSSKPNDENSLNSAVKSDVSLVRNPFTTYADTLPQAKQKRDKRNVAFTSEKAHDEKMTGINTNDPNETFAGVVVASLVQHILKHSFSEFIYSIKNVWRRDSPLLQKDDDLIFFQTASVFVQYKRLQLLNEFQEASEKCESENIPFVWKPDLMIPLQIMDRMTINRAASNLETLKQEKKLDKIVHPLEIFKEIVASTRLYLLSTEAFQHEVAIGTLHRLYYTAVTTERMDPLPALLRDWRPGVFCRKHLHTLVELVHETMKTLDEAKLLFNTRYSDGSARTFKSGDTMTNLASGLRFEPDEYFRRIITPNTVAIFTRVLENYATNPKNTNFHVYTFLRRLCNMKIEVDVYAGHNQSHELTMAYMTFNIQTILAFNKVLNDTNAANFFKKQNIALIPMIKSIIRMFGEASKKNHLLFTEILLSHPHAQHFCKTLDSVYDASQFAVTGGRVNSDSDDSKSYNGSDDDMSIASNKPVNNDYGDEFDDEEAARIQALPSVPKEKKVRKRSDRAKSTKKANVPKYNSDGDTNSEYESDADIPKKRPSSTKPSTKKRKKGAASAITKKKWTTEEDALIKEKYQLYAGTRSVYEMIALEEVLITNARAATDVEYRVQKLAKKGQLTLHTADKPEDPQAPLLVSSYSSSSSSTVPSDANRPSGEPIENRNLLPDVWATNDDNDDRDWTGAAPIRKSIGPESASASKEKESNRLKKKAVVNDDDDDDMFGANDDSPNIARNASSSNRGFKSAFTLDDDSD